MLAINGALRTTPTDLLDPHAGLLPMELLLKKICHRSAARICSLSPTNPVSKLAKKYASNPATRHVTSIQNHCDLFKLQPTKIEKILSIPKSNTPKYQVSPIQTKDESTEYEKNDNSPIKVYTDGSKTNGMVGAAAVSGGFC